MCTKLAQAGRGICRKKFLPYLAGISLLVIITIIDLRRGVSENSWALRAGASTTAKQVKTCTPSGQPLLHTSGASGQAFQMQAYRENIKLLSGVVKQNVGLNTSFLEHRPDTFPVCPTWVVITSVNPPTKTVQQLVKLPNICVCVVADLKSPENYDVQNVVYLTPALQRSLPYTIINHLPWNHFGRKNIGYLFAIHHGATSIYDTDDDNELVLGLQEIPYVKSEAVDLFFESALDKNVSALNVYPYFGASQAWPRGYPFDEVRTSTLTKVAVRQRKTRSLGVIQSLANKDPDVDAFYRLSPLPLPFSFNRDRTLVGLQPGVHICPYNAQATLHLKRAFWALLLPVSVHGRVSDIWRSYFAQRLLWESSVAIAFASPWVVQNRNVHSYLADLVAERQLYDRSSALVEYLTNTWVCDTTPFEPTSCLLALYMDMYRYGIVEAQDVDLVQAWIFDLKAIGYAP